ncbi:MAG: hypothetical protein DMG45_21440 [Acidobacteria bacterium]|nr:MAG: hypothetical protein AUH16_00510 [Acidobacteria bacterium 13_2_20CM_57_7]PYT38971.1 MAG: hypothetical protein DMG45_21440 [Acidobacteriota bacterium]
MVRVKNLSERTARGDASKKKQSQAAHMQNQRVGAGGRTKKRKRRRCRAEAHATLNSKDQPGEKGGNETSP